MKVGVFGTCTGGRNAFLVSCRVKGFDAAVEYWGGRVFTVSQVNVSYDRPCHAPLEHALNLDFVNEAQGPRARVAVKLTPDWARKQVQAIQTVLPRAEAGGYLDGGPAAAERVRAFTTEQGYDCNG